MPQDDPVFDAIRQTSLILAKDVYGDVFQPSAKRVGASLETLFKVGLTPVSVLDWGFEQCKDWLMKKVQDRRARTPDAFKAQPRTAIVVSTLAQIASNPDEPELRELFAEMLLKAMDSRTAQSVHPAYPSLLSQLAPQEALVFVSLRRLSDDNVARRNGDSVFSETRRSSWISTQIASLEMQFVSHCKALGFADQDLALVWLENLKRLQLVEVDQFSEHHLTSPELVGQRPEITSTETRYLSLTALGRGLLLCCTESPAERHDPQQAGDHPLRT